MKTLRYLFVTLIVAAFVVANFSTGKALTSSLVEVTNFGTNPSNLRMFVYIPTTVKPNPPILVAVHYCHGDGPAFFNGSQFSWLADQYGYIVIYPSVTQASDGCFDVASNEALTRNGGSDPVGIMSMVTYAEQHYNGDPNQVYVTGVSSGAMMTNVLLGDYPDVFKAGAAFAGVPFGCFAVNPDALRWSTACATGTVTHTPQEWGNIARAAYPGYSGPRPRMQVWHGTNDEVLNYVNFGEEIKQWTNVLGASQTPVSTDSPAAGQTRTRYANGSGTVVVEAISLQGVSHNLPVDAAAAIHFFGLDGSITPTPSITPGGPTLTPTFTATRTNTPLPPTITPTAPAGATCSPVNATISAPFTKDGSGTFCWQSNNLGSYINSWNLTSLMVNGVNFTNVFVASGSYPAQVGGYWYVAYNSSVSWGHFETGGTGGPTNTPAPATNTPAVSTNTPTRTNTASVPTNTPTRTNTLSVPTNIPTRTNTPVGPTNTPVPPTNTPIVPTNTPTQGSGGGTCSPVNATISAPFTKDGTGTFCWQSSNLGSYINSWNLASLTINGVNATNLYVASGSYPAQIGGYWYVAYNGPYAWSHFEAK